MKIDSLVKDVQLTEELEGIDFSIDQESMGMLFKGFSDHLYSNKIGSIVREITSNCFDSHIEAGVKVPVQITITEDYANYERCVIIFRDFGTGLSPERMKNIFSKYFASTKRDSNDNIGGWGIGAKSPLSYTDAFFIQTVYDKVEYNYIIHKGAKVPRLELVSHAPSEDKNGTDVKINIRNREDLRLFRSELKLQLRYFDNIDYTNCNIDNNYKIYQGNHFIVRINESDPVGEKLSICLGKVHYPLDFNQLELSAHNYDTPVALKFEIGDLPVTMNREAIEYTEKAKDVIRNKLIVASAELQQMYNKQIEDIDDLMEYANILTYGYHGARLTIEGVSIPMDSLVEKKKAVFKHLDPRIKVPADPFFEYNISGKIENGRKYIRLHHQHSDIKKLLEQHIPIYRLSGSLGKRKNLYLEQVEGKPFYVITKSPRSIGDMTRLLDLPDITDPGSDKTEKLIEEYRVFVQNYIVAHSKSYDRTDIPQDWINNYEGNLKANRASSSYSAAKNTVTIRKFGFIQQSYKRVVNFSMEDLTVSELLKRYGNGQIVIYGSNDDTSELTRVGQILTGLKNANRDNNSTHLDPKYAAVIKIATANFKYLESLRNTCHVSKFNEKYGKYLWRMWVGEELYGIYNSTYSHLNTDCLPPKVKSRAEALMYFLYDTFADGRFRLSDDDKEYAAKTFQGDLILYTDNKEINIHQYMRDLDEWVKQYPLIKNLSWTNDPVFTASLQNYLRKTGHSLLNY
jgi:hypothetical protein